MELRVFEFNSYKTYLKKLISSAEKKYGMTSKLAEAASCQRSYLSQVLNGNVHLTPDHGYGISQFLKFSEIEADYFLLLLEYDRAATSLFKSRIEAKLKKIRTDQQDLSKRISAKVIDIYDPITRYYSSWVWMAIHLLTSIPHYQTAKSIASRLEIPETLVLMTLQDLEKMEFVEKKDHQLWVYKGSNLHLTTQSPSVILHHNNWRQRALLDAALFSSTSIHYTSLVTLSKRDLEFIKTKLLDWIEQSRKIVEPSQSEELACISIDYFKV